MSSVPRTHPGIGGSVLATMRNVGMACGTAISSAVAVAGMRRLAHASALVDGDALLRGISFGFAVGACFVFLGAFTSLMRQDPPREPGRDLA